MNFALIDLFGATLECNFLNNWLNANNSLKTMTSLQPIVIFDCNEFGHIIVCRIRHILCPWFHGPRTGPYCQSSGRVWSRTGVHSVPTSGSTNAWGTHLGGPVLCDDIAFRSGQSVCRRRRLYHSTRWCISTVFTIWQTKGMVYIWHLCRLIPHRTIYGYPG